MIRVIGSLGCSRCEITKQVLKNKKVEFKYELISELSELEQDELLSKAQSKGMMNMPLILKDNELVDVKEI